MMKVVTVEGQTQPTADVVTDLKRQDDTSVVRISHDNMSMIFTHDPNVLILVAVPFQGWQLQFLRALRGWQRPPLCLAVTRPDPADAISLLEAGADAHCSYPIAPGLCAAQALALGRRSQAQKRNTEATETICIRDLTIDPARCQVSLAGEPLPMTPTEYRILACLASQPSKVVPIPTLFQGALGYAAPEDQERDIIKTHIRRIRQKIHDAGGPSDYVCNIRGFGYLLERRGKTRDSVMPWQGQTEPLIADLAPALN